MIRSKDQLKDALAVIDRLLAKVKLVQSEVMYLDALSDLVATYEDTHHPIAPPSDADMLRHLMDAKGVNQAQLSEQTGIAKSTVSEILSGKRTLCRGVIRKLAKFFHVDVGVLSANL